MQNEDKAVRTALMREAAAELENEKKQKFDESLNLTNRKMLNFQERKQSDLQMKQEALEKRMSNVKDKQATIDQYNSRNQEKLLDKMNKQEIQVEATMRQKQSDLDAKFSYE